MNLRSLADGVLEHFNYSTDGESEARNRIVRHLNEWHRRILSKPGMDRLRQSAITVASTASSPTLALPSSVVKMLRVRDLTNDITLNENRFDWYRFAEPDPASSTGTPTTWVPVGYAACADLAAAAGTGIWVESASTSDTYRAYIEGVRLGGYVWSDTVIMTGQTRVAVGSLTDWIEITKFVVEQPAVGLISLYKVATVGTALAAIPIGKTESRYWQIALWPTPSSAVTYYIDYQRALLDMVNDTDTPLIPEDFHWILQHGAKANEYDRIDDSRAPKMRAEMEMAIGELRATLHSRDVIVPGRSNIRLISRINGWCPADTVVR